jgi:short-subunit dehydrogenase
MLSSGAAQGERSGMTAEEYRNRYGPTALVTGASSGIGLAFAEELAERGFDLVLTARRVERMEALAARLAEAHGTHCRIVGADLSDPAAPARLLAATEGVDIGLVVSNAGFNMKGAHDRKKPSHIAKLLTVNCHAPLLLANGFIPRLKARGAAGRGAGIIFNASFEGFIGNPYSAAYAASKALVVSLGEGLWAELLGTGVDVLTLCPGATESEATLRDGYTSTLKLQPAREVAQRTLDAIAEGPTFLPSAELREQLATILNRPRREALTEMAANMRTFFA